MSDATLIGKYKEFYNSESEEFYLPIDIAYKFIQDSVNSDFALIGFESFEQDSLNRKIIPKLDLTVTYWHEKANNWEEFKNMCTNSAMESLNYIEKNKGEIKQIIVCPSKTTIDEWKKQKGT